MKSIEKIIKNNFKNVILPFLVLVFLFLIVYELLTGNVTIEGNKRKSRKKKRKLKRQHRNVINNYLNRINKLNTENRINEEKLKKLNNIVSNKNEELAEKDQLLDNRRKHNIIIVDNNDRLKKNIIKLEEKNEKDMNTIKLLETKTNSLISGAPVN